VLGPGDVFFEPAGARIVACALPVLPLQLASVTLAQVAAHRHGNFTGTVYVATPQLLARYGIKASQISPGTDILTALPRCLAWPACRSC
jgi:hypothetical protein